MKQWVKHRQWLAAGVFVMLVLGLLAPVRAGNLDSPAPPTDPASAMYTLENVYNRLDTGAAGAQSVFAEPGAGPGSTGHTLNQVMSKAPATNANAAAVGEALSGKVFWGLGLGVWGQQTGTMPNRGAVTLTPGAAQQAIQQGYHNGTGYVEGDADLATGNIKAGVNIFGVAGKTEVVDTTSGTAVAGEIMSGRKAWVGGAEVTGALATLTLAPTTTAVAAGYYAATNLDQVDTDLAVGNIRAGVVVFGVTGKTEVVDTTSGDAAAGNMLTGKKAWVAGTEVTGTAPAGGNLNGGDGALVVTITDGLYTGSKTATANDSDLVTGNIKAGVNIFGVAGDGNVVNTVSGDATAAEILATKKAYVDGTEVTGTMATRTLSDANDTVQAGYYAATTLSAVDTDLATANVKAGTTIFGVAGDANVVNTSSGDAAAADVLASKKAWVDGAEVTGTANISAYPAPVAKSGAGDLPSYTEVAGEDGHAAMRKGVAWPGTRFTDNANGTVTDNLTGLIWLKDANFKAGTRTWANALTDCATLNSGEGGLTDGSAEGDWRLPNVQELQSLIDYGKYSPALPAGHPFTGVVSSYYWSGTTRADETTYAWVVYLGGGYVVHGNKGSAYDVWPVRGGQ